MMHPVGCQESHGDCNYGFEVVAAKARGGEGVQSLSLTGPIHAPSEERRHVLQESSRNQFEGEEPPQLLLLYSENRL